MPLARKQGPSGPPCVASADFPETVLVAAVTVVAFDTEVSVGRTAVALLEECVSADGIIKFYLFRILGMSKDAAIRVVVNEDAY